MHPRYSQQLKLEELRKESFLTFQTAPSNHKLRGKRNNADRLKMYYVSAPSILLVTDSRFVFAKKNSKGIICSNPPDRSFLQLFPHSNASSSLLLFCYPEFTLVLPLCSRWDPKLSPFLEIGGRRGSRLLFVLLGLCYNSRLISDNFCINYTHGRAAVRYYCIYYTGYKQIFVSFICTLTAGFELSFPGAIMMLGYC